MPDITNQGVTLDVAAEGPEVSPDHGLDATVDWTGRTAQLADPDFLARTFNHIFEEADRYRDQFAREWLLAFQQYNGNTDTHDKAAWQSNIHVPLAAQAVDTIASKIVTAMFSTEDDFFEMDPEVVTDEQIVAFAKHCVGWQLRKSESKDNIKDGMKDALICGNGFLKIHFQRFLQAAMAMDYQAPKPLSVFGRIIRPLGGKYTMKSIERAISKLRVDCGVPTNYWKDPTGKNRFIIERVTRGLSDLWAMTEDERDPETGEIIRPAIYDKDVVRRIRPGTHDAKRFIEEAAIKRDMANMSGTRPQQTVDIYELHGDMVDPNTGVVLFRNQLSTYVDRRWCVRKPQRNPFFHAKPPYIAVHAKRLPHQTYGYGVLQQNSKIQEAVNRNWNVILDKMQLQVPAMGYDSTRFKNARDMAGDNPTWRPGKMFAFKPGTIQAGQQNAMVPVATFPGVTEWDVAVNDRLTQLHGMGIATNETATGDETTKRKTKLEVQSQVGANTDIYNDVAVYIEESAIGKLLRMVYDTMLQYEDAYDDPTLLRAFGDQREDARAFLQMVKRLSPEQRWKMFKLDTEFRAVGITNELTRKAKIQDRQAFLQWAQGFPMFMQRLNVDFLLSDMVQLYRFPRAAIMSPEQAMAQAQQQAALGTAATPEGATPQSTVPQPANPNNQLAAAVGNAGKATAPGR